MGDILSEAVKEFGPSQPSARGASAAFGERRRRSRWNVHWAIRFPGLRSDPGETATVNLSSSGFYCFTSARFLSGETVRCLILLPEREPSEPASPGALECQARVLRVEPSGVMGMDGVAFRILEYRVL